MGGIAWPKKGKSDPANNTSSHCAILIVTAMSEAKFNKAVAIIQSLPKDGPVKPSTDDQLFVRYKSYPDLTDFQ